MSWQPIETAPAYMTQSRAIWVGARGKMEPVWWRHGHGKGRWHNAYTDTPIDWEPTHWQPLPEPPA